MTWLLLVWVWLYNWMCSCCDIVLCILKMHWFILCTTCVLAGYIVVCGWLCVCSSLVPTVYLFVYIDCSNEWNKKLNKTMQYSVIMSTNTCNRKIMQFNIDRQWKKTTYFVRTIIRCDFCQVLYLASTPALYRCSVYISVFTRHL